MKTDPDDPGKDFRMEFKTQRYDRFTGVQVEVPAWLPDAHVGVLRKASGEFEVYVDVSWDGGGWVCRGSGATEVAAANDLVRRLRRLST